MKTPCLLILTLGATMLAHADFSYTTERKTAQGAAAAAGAESTKYYLKGEKLKVETAETANILDFDAQTVTTINQRQKTYTVTPFSEVGQAAGRTAGDVRIDVKETGTTKSINGYNASELLMTMDAPQAGPAGVKMQMEMDLWLSKEVPGIQEFQNFYQKNAARFPWAALGGGGNPAMQNGIIEMQKKLASMGGVPVEQVVRVKQAGNNPQAAQMQAQMAQMRARLEAMIQQGGPQAEVLKQQLARMGAMGGSGGALMEITMDSRDFSTAAIPDSVFAVPAGYQKTAK